MVRVWRCEGNGLGVLGKLLQQSCGLLRPGRMDKCRLMSQWWFKRGEWGCQTNRECMREYFVLVSWMWFGPEHMDCCMIYLFIGMLPENLHGPGLAPRVCCTLHWAVFPAPKGMSS